MHFDHEFINFGFPFADIDRGLIPRINSSKNFEIYLKFIICLLMTLFFDLIQRKITLHTMNSSMILNLAMRVPHLQLSYHVSF